MKNPFITYILISFLFLVSFIYAQPVAPDPIILIPGIGASWNSNVFFDVTPVQTPWTFNEGVKFYDILLDSLIEKGYVLNQTLFVAHYDWRQSNINSANDYLIPVIDQAVQNSQTGKVDIIAHSMGGLVARAYIQGNNYHSDVDQLFLLGTPNYGSSDAYVAWEGGNIPGHWDKAVKDRLDRYFFFLKLFVPLVSDNYDAVHTFIPSIKELLPEYDYLVDKNTNDIKLEYTLNEQNPLLAFLNSESKLTELRERVGEITMIGGQGENTVDTIPVVDRGTEPKLWVDGQPDPLDPVPNTDFGDNTILAFSAFIDFPFDPVPVRDDTSPFLKWLAQFTRPVFAQTEAPVFSEIINSSHENLPTTAIPDIFDHLGLLPAPEDLTPSPAPDDILSFWFASPVDIKIVSPSGGEITKDANNIPDAFYEATSDPLGPKFVTILNPQDGQWSVELLGIGDGEYHMGVSHIDDDSDNLVLKEGVISTGERIGYNVSFTSVDETPADVSDPIPLEEEETAVEVAEKLLAKVDELTDVKVKKVLTASFKLLIAELKALEEVRERLESNPTSLLKLKEKLLTAAIKFHIKTLTQLIGSYENKGKVPPEAADFLTSGLEEISQKI